MGSARGEQKVGAILAHRFVHNKRPFKELLPLGLSLEWQEVLSWYRVGAGLASAVSIGMTIGDL